MTHKTKNNWVKAGDEYFVRSIAQNVEKLPVGIYTVKINPQNKELYLEFSREKFEFPFKVYGIEESFVARVAKTYNAVSTNLGVLLNGIKGTGKSVTAELICNALNVPVILVTEDLPGLVSFMNEFNQEVVFFMDEYEKTFKGEGRDERSHKLLSIMDGCLNTSYKKVFLFTTNNLYVDDNLLQRPGRIRYRKTFGNLSPEAIMEILKDKLERPDFHDSLFNLISQLEIVTVDIVCSLVSEVNIHNEDPEVFFPVFNLEKLDAKKDVYAIIPDEVTGAPVEKLVGLGMEVHPFMIEEDDIGETMEINNKWVGEISEIHENGNITVFQYISQDSPKELSSNVVERVAPFPENPTSNKKYTTYRFAAVPTYRSGFKKYLV